VAIRYERTVSFLDVMPKSRPANEQTHGVEYSTELVGINTVFLISSPSIPCSTLVVEVTKKPVKRTHVSFSGVRVLDMC
jgi:hypothetical protein